MANGSHLSYLGVIEGPPLRVVVCPLCGRDTVQNFPTLDYSRCMCRLHPPKKHVRQPSRARLAAIWTRRKELPR